MTARNTYGSGMSSSDIRRQVITVSLAMIISLWVHILGLALLRYVDPTPARPSPPPLMLEIELPALEKPEAPPKEKQEPFPKKAGARVEKPVEAKPPKTDAPPAAAQIPPGDTAAEPSVDDGSPPEEETISIESTAPEYLSFLGQIKAAVKNHWIFPPQAREKQYTGRVTAVFTLDRRGELLKIVVEESSGHPILDHAALEAVRGASPFPAFPDHINLKRLNIRALFDYRIKFITVK